MGVFYIKEISDCLKDCVIQCIRNNEVCNFHEEESIVLYDQDQLVVYDSNGSKLEDIALICNGQYIFCNQPLCIKEDSEVQLVRCSLLEVQLESHWVKDEVIQISCKQNHYDFIFHDQCFYNELWLQQDCYQINQSCYYDYYLDGILMQDTCFKLCCAKHSLRIVLRQSKSLIKLKAEQELKGWIKYNEEKCYFDLNSHNQFQCEMLLDKGMYIQMHSDANKFIIDGNITDCNELLLCQDVHEIMLKSIKEGTIVLTLNQNYDVELCLCHENDVYPLCLSNDQAVILEHMPFGMYEINSEQSIALYHNQQPIEQMFCFNQEKMHLEVDLIDTFDIQIQYQNEEPLIFYIKKSDEDKKEICLEANCVFTITNLPIGCYEIISDEEFMINDCSIFTQPYFELCENQCWIIEKIQKYSICFTSDEWVDLLVDDHCFRYINEFIVYDMEVKAYHIEVEEEFEIIIDQISYGSMVLLKIDQDLCVHIQRKKQEVKVEIALVEKNIEHDCIQKVDDGYEYEFTLIHQQEKQTYVFNEKNQYRKTLQLKKGCYQIETNFKSKLRINQQMLDQHEFMVEDKNLQIVLVKEDYFASLDVCLFAKKEERFIMPNKEYQVCIKDEKEEHCFVLNQENAYQIRLEGIRYGTYQISVKNESIWYSFNQNDFQVNQEITINQAYNQLNLLLCHFIKMKVQDATQPMNVVIESNSKKEIYELNEYNQYEMILINDKEMELRSNDAECFIVGEEKYHCVEMKQTQDYDILMIAKQKGKLKLELFEEQNHGLKKPMKKEYVVMVGKMNEVKEYLLNDENQYRLQINDLDQGLYVVTIKDFNDIAYVVNGGSVVDKAIVSLNHELQSINMIVKEKKGKMILKNHGKKAEMIQISGPNYFKELKINRNEEVSVNQLEKGNYVLKSDQLKHYQIDRGTLCDHARINVDQSEHEVDIYDRKTSVVHVEMYYEDEWGFHLGKAHDSYQIVIKNEEETHEYILESRNDFKLDIDHLTYGIYEVNLEKSNHPVDLLIDSKQTNQLVINEDYHYVQIIHRLKKQSSLTIKKWIKNGNGKEILPADGDEFEVELSSSQEVVRLILNGRNQFQVVLEGLKEGIYQIKELNNEAYQTTYRVNQEEVQQASIVMNNKNQALVEIINERNDNLNTIEVFKYFLDEKGQYIPPKEGSFEFVLSSAQINERYVLDENNQWHLSIKNQPSGSYQIKEVTSENKVRYFVNSATLQNEALFNINASEVIVVGIINEIATMKETTLTIQKRLEQQEDLNSLSFIIELFNDNFKERYVLSKDNDYTIRVDLMYGEYYIQELKENNAKFILDGMVVENKIVLDQEMQYLEIINQKIRNQTVMIEL